MDGFDGQKVVPVGVLTTWMLREVRLGFLNSAVQLDRCTCLNHLAPNLEAALDVLRWTQPYCREDGRAGACQGVGKRTHLVLLFAEGKRDEPLTLPVGQE